MLWSSNGILLNDAVRDRIEIVVVLLKCCRTPLALQITPATGINNPISVKGLQSGHCFLQNSRKVRRSLSGPISHSSFCDASLHLLIFCVWLIPLRNCSLCWCDSNFSINLENCRLSLFILLLNCWEGYAWNSVIHPVSRKLCASLCVFQDHLASCLGGSWNPHCEFALRTTRGLALPLR